MLMESLVLSFLPSRHKEELDKVSAYLVQLEKHSEKVQSEIAVRRRATYVAEEEIANLEKAKDQQDRLIDGLESDIKTLSEKVGMYDSQLAQQHGEKDVAARTLAEAQNEMEVSPLLWCFGGKIPAVLRVSVRG